MNAAGERELRQQRARERQAKLEALSRNIDASWHSAQAILAERMALEELDSQRQYRFFRRLAGWVQVVVGAVLVVATLTSDAQWWIALAGLVLVALGVVTAALAVIARDEAKEYAAEALQRLEGKAHEDDAHQYSSAPDPHRDHR